MVKKIRLSVTLTRQYLDALKELVNKGVYVNRGEVVRAGLGLLFKYHKIAFVEEESED